MTWDGRPWFIGGGAQHSPEVARLLAYASTGAAEGVVSPGDLKVAPTAVPGASVRVLAGAGLILNKAAGGSQQTYVAWNPSEDVVSIAATGSGSGRSDLIVARIEDPNMAGEPWAVPADRANGQYVFTRVISNVTPGTTTMPTGQSGIPLARIDIPSSTGTITAGMIVDLRKLARPRSTSDLLSQATPQPLILAKSNTFVNWPGWNPVWTVPDWATWISTKIDLASIGGSSFSVDGELRARLDFNVGADLVSGPLLVQIPTNSPSRENFILTASGPVPTGARTVTVNVEGRIYTTSVGQIGTNPASHMAIDVRFYERTT